MMLYFVECTTGCTCGVNGNHFVGPYSTETKAKTEIGVFLVQGRHGPSSAAHKCHYSVICRAAEVIPGNRWIVSERVLSAGLYPLDAGRRIDGKL